MMTVLPHPTRFDNGVTNVGPQSPFANFKQPDPRLYHIWYDDFDKFTVADWTVTETQAGATQGILADGDGGILALVNSAADDDLNAIQWPAETFLWAPGKDMVVAAKVNVSHDVESDIIAGLYITDTSPLASLPTDGLFFLKADGAAALSFHIRKDGVSTQIAMGDIAALTYYDCVAQYLAATGEWLVYLNGALTGRSSVLVNAPDDEALAPGIAVQNGDAVARTLLCDWMFFAKER